MQEKPRGNIAIRKEEHALCMENVGAVEYYDRIGLVVAMLAPQNVKKGAKYVRLVESFASSTTATNP